MSKRDRQELAAVEAEQAILTGLICDNNLIYKALELEEYHFQIPIHQDIFKSMKARILRGEAASIVTMSKELRDNTRRIYNSDGEDTTPWQYFAMLAGGNRVFSPVFVEYCEIVIDVWKRLQLNIEMSEQIKRVWSGSHEDNIISITNEMLKICMEYGSNKKTRPQSASEVTQDIIADMDKDLPCYSTGLPCMDMILGGGLYSSMAYNISAYMKGGKTTMMKSISTNLHNAGVKHAYICAEMGSKQIHQRHIARMIGENSLSFYKKRKDTEFVGKVFEYNRKEAEHAERVGKTMIYLSRPHIKLEDLKKECYALVRKDGVKGIFLDYVQLVKGRDRGESPVEHLENVCDWIANFVKDEGIFLVTASQLNREGQIRGGDGVKMYFDWVGNLILDKARYMAWMETTDCRYTQEQNAGSKDSPSLELLANGVHFGDIMFPERNQTVMEL